MPGCVRLRLVKALEKTQSVKKRSIRAMKDRAKWVRLVRYWIRTHVASNPTLFHIIYYRLLNYPDYVLVNSESKILIEGFPRSGNTFAAWAFHLANPEADFAHHMHNPAHVILALRYRVPSIVLIREPVDAVRSLCVRHQHISPRLGLSSYIKFYKCLRPYKGQFVIGQFETLKTNYWDILRALNRRYQTDFQLLEPTPENQSRVFSAIDNANKSAHDDVLNPRHVPRPHPDRNEWKAEVSFAGLETLLRRARRLFEEFQRNAV